MALHISEATALLSTGLAAVAATASWASVIQSRKSLKESVLPDLHVIAQRVEPSGPVYGMGQGVTSVQFDVYNAGGGIAKGALYLLVHGMEYVVGFTAPMVRPGETYRIRTDMTPMGADQEWHGVITCLDLHNNWRTWKLPHGRKPTLTKASNEDRSATEIYESAFPQATLRPLTRKRARVERIDP